MKQTIDKHGNLIINLFEICDQQDDAKFIYFYLGLDKSIKKIIENAFYTAYTKKLLDKEHPEIIHHEENGLTHIEVHPKDIVRNIEIIKRILLAGNSKVVVEDENE